ncbi:MAG TPA: hypothetical protein VJ840_17915 [Gemmatimonadaceae bacterium]|nr:hypothetical protein [Gemmatimonadaceae bacterium]
MTAGTLHVVVSCKSRKTVDVPANLRMSTVRGVDLSERMRDWVMRLQTTRSVEVPASGMYGGDHWRVILRIPEAAGRQLDVRLWVVSAGYGLVSIDTQLKPYSATFIPSHAESIAPRFCAYSTADWWRELGRWRPVAYGGPRTLDELATSLMGRRDVLLLALSQPYALALREDIASAERKASGRVALVSVGLAAVENRSTLASLLPVEARLKQRVGGAMQGVNGRIAEMMVREHAKWFPSVDKLRALVCEWVADAPALPIYDRAVQSEDEVRQFIRDHAKPDQVSSRTGMLRALRDSGRACEQSRFRRLYDEVMEMAGSTLAPSPEAGSTGK